MISEVIDLIIDNRIPTTSEEVKIARGKYELPLTFGEVFRKMIRKIKRIE